MMTKTLSAARKLGVATAVAATFNVPLLSVPAWASPTTQVAPHPAPQVPMQPHSQAPVPHPAPVQHPNQGQIPSPAQVPPPAHTPPPAQHTQPPVQAPEPTHTAAPTHAPAPTHEPTQTVPAEAPSSHAPTSQAPVNAPKAGEPVRTPAPGHSVETTVPAHEPKQTTGPHATPTPQTAVPSGRQSAVITRGSAVSTIPVAAAQRGLAAPHESIDAARTAPAVHLDAAAPPPVAGNFNERVQNAIRVNPDRDVDVIRPRHWDYVDYDDCHRPVLFNPLGTDVTFRYFYNGAYQTVLVPVGGRVVLDAAVAGVFPFTMLAGDLISVGSFLGGAFIPPADWVGPPPADWQPWAPVTYTGVPVDFANLGKTVLVDQVTEVGHDDSLPAGQRDVVLLNDSTLARGEIQPSPEGGPPHIALQQTQPLPGVGPWDNGQQYIDTAIGKPASPPSSDVPWVIGGLAVVLTLLGGVAAWVWKHPRGAHALAGAPTANAPTESFEPVSPTNWMYSDTSGYRFNPPEHHG